MQAPASECEQGRLDRSHEGHTPGHSTVEQSASRVELASAGAPRSPGERLPHPV